MHILEFQKLEKNKDLYVQSLGQMQLVTLVDELIDLKHNCPEVFQPRIAAVQTWVEQHLKHNLAQVLGLDLDINIEKVKDCEHFEFKPR